MSVFNRIGQTINESQVTEFAQHHPSPFMVDFHNRSRLLQAEVPALNVPNQIGVSSVRLLGLPEIVAVVGDLIAEGVDVNLSVSNLFHALARVADGGPAVVIFEFVDIADRHAVQAEDHVPLTQPEVPQRRFPLRIRDQSGRPYRVPVEVHRLNSEMALQGR